MVYDIDNVTKWALQHARHFPTAGSELTFRVTLTRTIQALIDYTISLTYIPAIILISLPSDHPSTVCSPTVNRYLLRNVSFGYSAKSVGAHSFGPPCCSAGYHFRFRLARPPEGLHHGTEL